MFYSNITGFSQFQLDEIANEICPVNEQAGFGASSQEILNLHEMVTLNELVFVKNYKGQSLTFNLFIDYLIILLLFCLLRHQVNAVYLCHSS